MLMDSGNTLLTILGDILDFSKIDARCMTLQSRPLDLRASLEASLQMASSPTQTNTASQLQCRARIAREGSPPGGAGSESAS